MAFLAPALIEQLRQETSSNSRYLNPSKIEGEARLRFLGEGKTGFESWTLENKPVRWEQRPKELPDNIKRDDTGAKPCRRFLAAIVYDYQDDAFKCINITQKCLLDAVFKLCEDPDYGDPNNYDIKIERKGEKLLTTYTLTPCPPKDLSPKVATRWKEECEKINLDNLYSGEEIFLN